MWNVCEMCVECVDSPTPWLLGHPRVLSAEEKAEELSNPVCGPSSISVGPRVPGAGCRALAKGAQPTH